MNSSCGRVKIRALISHRLWNLGLHIQIYEKSARYCSGRLSDVKKLLFHVTLHIVVVRAETLEGGTVEFLLCRRVGYGDDQACALLQRLAVEVYGPVLGYEPVDVVAGRDDACA